mmetsp:Transcript_70111/g.198737  ORF Transcript_70111/g.198737 Transcript_70111/m.198737 type:complete len:285 (+) Transcript_70111:2-856(+)
MGCSEVEDLVDLERQTWVTVQVEAEDEDDQVYHWTQKVAPNEPLYPLRRLWAEAHSVAESAVGFEDYNDNPVDLNRTPVELKWSCQATVHVHAVPVDMRFAEGFGGPGPKAPEAAAEPAEPAAAKRRRAEATTDGSTCAAAAEVVGVAPPSGTQEPPAAPAVAARIGGTATADKAPKKRGRPPNASKKASEDSVPPEQASGGAGAAAPKQDQPVSQGSQGSQGLVDGDAIEFNQCNPKKAGSLAYDRYEKYKLAHTFNEALQLGACKGDLAYDKKKGFLKVVTP